MAKEVISGIGYAVVSLVSIGSGGGGSSNSTEATRYSPLDPNNPASIFNPKNFKNDKLWEPVDSLHHMRVAMHNPGELILDKQGVNRSAPKIDCMNGDQLSTELPKDFEYIKALIRLYKELENATKKDRKIKNVAKKKEAILATITAFIKRTNDIIKLSVQLSDPKHLDGALKSVENQRTLSSETIDAKIKYHTELHKAGKKNVGYQLSRRDELIQALQDAQIKPMPVIVDTNQLRHSRSSSASSSDLQTLSSGRTPDRRSRASSTVAQTSPDLASHLSGPLTYHRNGKSARVGTRSDLTAQLQPDVDLSAIVDNPRQKLANASKQFQNKKIFERVKYYDDNHTFHVAVKRKTGKTDSIVCKEGARQGAASGPILIEVNPPADANRMPDDRSLLAILEMNEIQPLTLEHAENIDVVFKVLEASALLGIPVIIDPPLLKQAEDQLNDRFKNTQENIKNLELLSPEQKAVCRNAIENGEHSLGTSYTPPTPPVIFGPGKK